MPRHLDPRRALAHPLWWVALALLAANDHLFKGAGVLPTALTGKLSDVVGLLVAPALLAALCGVRHRRGWITAHLAVGAGFAAINISPAIARAVEAMSLTTPFPWMITVDPTDLVTLPMLALSAVMFGRWSARPIALRPLVARAGVALGGLACVATSPPNEERPMWDASIPDFDVEQANLMVANRTGDVAVVRVRPLADPIRLDCDAVGRDPTAALSPDLFTDATVWSVDPDRGFPLLGHRDGCDAMLLGGATGNRLVFIDTSRWLPRWLATGGDTLDGEQTIEVTGQGAAAHPALHRAPPRESDPPIGACANPPVGAGIDWIRPVPSVQRRVVTHTVSADGCHALELLEPGRGDIDRWYICAPGVPLHFDADEPLDIVDGETWIELRLADRTVSLYQSDALPADLLVEPEPIEGCAPYRDDCDGYIEPLALRHGADTFVAGEHVELIDGRDLYVVRAERAQVIDTECHLLPWLGDRFEVAVIAHAEAPEEDAR